jgi:hypothetical protein
MRYEPHTVMNVGDLTVEIHQDMDPISPSEHYDGDMFLAGWARDFSVKSAGFDCLADFHEFIHPHHLDEYDYPVYIRDSSKPTVKPERFDEVWVSVYKDNAPDLEQLLLESGEEIDYANPEAEAAAESDLQARCEVWNEWERYKNAHAEYACFTVVVNNYGGGTIRLFLGDVWDGGWDRREPEAMIRIRRSAGWREDLKALAESIINEWNMYLEGDVWGYVVKDENDNELDSCWGFYGLDTCEDEGRSVAVALDKTRVKQMQLPFGQPSEEAHG